MANPRSAKTYKATASAISMTVAQTYQNPLQPLTNTVEFLVTGGAPPFTFSATFTGAQTVSASYDGSLTPFSPPAKGTLIRVTYTYNTTPASGQSQITVNDSYGTQKKTTFTVSIP